MITASDITSFDAHQHSSKPDVASAALAVLQSWDETDLKDPASIWDFTDDIESIRAALTAAGYLEGGSNAT